MSVGTGLLCCVRELVWVQLLYGRVLLVGVCCGVEEGGLKSCVERVWCFLRDVVTS